MQELLISSPRHPPSCANSALVLAKSTAYSWLLLSTSLGGLLCIAIGIFCEVASYQVLSLEEQSVLYRTSSGKLSSLCPDESWNVALSAQKQPFCILWLTSTLKQTLGWQVFFANRAPCPYITSLAILMTAMGFWTLCRDSYQALMLLQGTWKQIINCGAIVWSNTHQLPTVFLVMFQACMSHKLNEDTVLQTAPVGRTFRWVKIMWLGINIFYVPGALAMIVTCVVPGSVVFFPIALILGLMGTIAWWLNIARDHCTDLLPDDSNMCASCSGKLHVEFCGLGILAIPAVVACSFFGEAMTRIYLGDSWWYSCYRTWVDRSIEMYTHGCVQYSSFLMGVQA